MDSPGCFFCGFWQVLCDNCIEVDVAEAKHFSASSPKSAGLPRDLWLNRFRFFRLNLTGLVYLDDFTREKRKSFLFYPRFPYQNFPIRLRWALTECPDVILLSFLSFSWSRFALRLGICLSENPGRLSKALQLSRMTTSLSSVLTSPMAPQ